MKVVLEIELGHRGGPDADPEALALKIGHALLDEEILLAVPGDLTRAMYVVKTVTVAP